MLSVHTCPLAALGGKETGGMNVYVRELGRELGRKGLAVDVFTRCQNEEVPEIVQMGDSARVIHLKAGPTEPYDKNLVFNHLGEFSTNLQAFADREGFQYDLIHAHYWLSGWVGVQMARRWHVPLVSMFHTLALVKNAIARTESQRETGPRAEIERYVMHQSQAVVAANPTEKAQMTWFYGASPAKIRVIPCGVDTALFRPTSRREAKRRLNLEGRRVILFVGRLDWLKGIDSLIQATKLASEAFSGSDQRVHLLVIGGDTEHQAAGPVGEEARRLRRLARELGLEDAISFLGAQPQQELPTYYAAADVCVVPSFYESFGMVALEAMACGTPVIASNVGGLAFTVQDGKTGFLVPEEHSAILAERILQLLRDPRLRTSFGSQASAVAQGYGWPAVTEQVLGLYQDVLSAETPTRCHIDRCNIEGNDWEGREA
jgi:D-inositol-3-phosphate glycosyltransferase